jgi:hypothetical protein
MPKCSEFHVQLPRHSLDSVSWNGRKPVAAALKDIYRTVDAAAGEAALTALRGVLLGPEMPGDRPELGAAPGARSSRSMLFPPTSAAFCTPRMPSRRSIPSCAGQFGPGDITPATRQTTKLLFLVLNRAPRAWIMPPREWCMAKAPVRRPLRRALHTSHGLIILAGQKFLIVPASFKAISIDWLHCWAPRSLRLLEVDRFGHAKPGQLGCVAPDHPGSRQLALSASILFPRALRRS